MLIGHEELRCIDVASSSIRDEYMAFQMKSRCKLMKPYPRLSSQSVVLTPARLRGIILLACHVIAMAVDLSSFTISYGWHPQLRSTSSDISRPTPSIRRCVQLLLSVGGYLKYVWSLLSLD